VIKLSNTAYSDQYLQRLLKSRKKEMFTMGGAFDNQISDPTDPDARSLEMNIKTMVICF
jgi:outer membrane protein insertion porin family